MLTKMTDADWIRVLRVFEIVRSRRGDKGRDDRKFLSALALLFGPQHAAIIKGERRPSINNYNRAN